MTHGRFKNPIEATLAGIQDIFKKQPLASKLHPQDRIDGKNCLITGANSGLGFAIAVDLAKRGGNIWMACRSGIPEKGEQVKKLSQTNTVEMLPIDLADVKSIVSFCENIKKKGIRFDIIILNAGVTPPKARKTLQGLDEMFMVNYLSNFILIDLLLQSQLVEAEKSTRILFISSDSHQGASAIDFESFGKFENYGVKKAIQNYSYFKLILNTYATELAKRLASPTISVNVMCPGPVNTNIIRDAPFLLRWVLRFIFYLFFQTPTKAALPVSYLCCSKDWEGTTNQYLHMFRLKKMDEKCYDENEGKKLWEASKKLWQTLKQSIQF